MKGKNFLYLVLALSALLTLPSCGGGGGGGGGTATTSQPGSLSLGLTDASTDAYQAVYVTISEVQVHMTADSWKVVASPNKTYNLLDLVNGVREQLGIAELDAGNYTEMRLIIGETPDGGINILSQKHPYANYVIEDPDDTVHELKIPSGYQAGVKIVHNFTISANQTTELILDFNASESVVVAGKSGKWLLKPTIKVLNTAEWAIISGTVTTPAQSGASQSLAGVLVSAQYTQSATDTKDAVVTETSTVSEENGQYKLFIKPATYNMVAYSAGYYPDVVCPVPLNEGQLAEVNFILDPAHMGTVSVSVSIEEPAEDQYATLSFRQSVDCDGDGTGETFEVKSVNVINGTYPVSLPEGDYELVASSYGKVTTSSIDPVVVTGGTITEVAIELVNIP